MIYTVEMGRAGRRDLEHRRSVSAVEPLHALVLLRIVYLPAPTRSADVRGSFSGTAAAPGGCVKKLSSA